METLNKQSENDSKGQSRGFIDLYSQILSSMKLLQD